MWSQVRKLSAVDCNLTYLHAPMLPQLLVSLPLGWGVHAYIQFPKHEIEHLQMDYIVRVCFPLAKYDKHMSPLVTELMGTPPMWSQVRKISAVDCDLTYLKAPMLPQLVASLPLGWSLKSFVLDVIFTSIHSQILDEVLKLSPVLMSMLPEGDSNSYLFLP